jgi:hypothetical protein
MYKGTQVEVFWVMTLCSVVVGGQISGKPCCLHLQSHNQKTLPWITITVKTSNLGQSNCSPSTYGKKNLYGFKKCNTDIEFAEKEAAEGPRRGEHQILDSHLSV